ncbi:MAG: hypothetical protein AB1485_02910 [Candidatus Thermoplasmatota archaeon]
MNRLYNVLSFDEIMMIVCNLLFIVIIVAIVLLFMYLRKCFPAYFVSAAFKKLPCKTRAKISAKLVIILAALLVVFRIIWISLGFYIPVLDIFMIVLAIVFIVLGSLQLVGVPTFEKIQAFVRKG